MSNSPENRNISYPNGDINLEIDKSSEIDWDSMKIIAGYKNPTDAHIVKGRLLTMGVFCILADRNTVLKFGKKDICQGDIKLMVKDIDLYKAKEILEDQFNDDIDTEEEIYESLCPECKSSDIVYEKMQISHTIINFVLLGLPNLFYRRKWVCLRCGHEWKEV